jgi:Pectinacetylesterase
MSLLRCCCVLSAEMCSSLLSGVAVGETSVATAPVESAVEILPPEEPWAGLTRGEWDARWWQWAVSMPDEINPNFDTSGERCGYGQSGPVFFLPGNVIGEEPAEITCVVAAGTAIYVNVAGTECSTVEPPPFFGRTEAELRACATETLNRATDYQARVDGQDVADLDAYRTESPLFTLTFADDNTFGVEPGVAQSVSEAYSFIIAPLPPGEYEIAVSTMFAGAPAPFATTATVIVEAPHVIEAAPTGEVADSVSDGSSAPFSDVDSGEWELVRPGGDCQCSDGTDYAFFVRHDDPAKVMFFLQGGGACFSADTCNPSSGTYDPNIDSLDNPALLDGIFDSARPDNPFRDHSVVFVPYCTGDIHIGNNAAEYSPELTVQHRGWVNGTAARDYLAENFPDAAQVVVVGASAGSMAAPLYAGAISDQLPDAQITVLADSSGAYPDATNSAIADVWGSNTTRAAFPEYTGDWSLPRFFVAAGLHDPEIVMARFDFAFDAVQSEFMAMTGADTSDLVASMDSNEALIEEAGVTQHSYTAPGDNHTIVQGSEFYEMVVSDVPLVDWVTALIGGQPMEDVHCDDCQAPG